MNHILWRLHNSSIPALVIQGVKQVVDDCINCWLDRSKNGTAWLHNPSPVTMALVSPAGHQSSTHHMRPPLATGGFPTNLRPKTPESSVQAGIGSETEHY
jgi:hypothetical protein